MGYLAFAVVAWRPSGYLAPVFSSCLLFCPSSVLVSSVLVSFVSFGLIVPSLVGYAPGRGGVYRAQCFLGREELDVRQLK